MKFLDEIRGTKVTSIGGEARVPRATIPSFIKVIELRSALK